MGTSVLGQRVLRREDNRFLTGSGCFVDDLDEPVLSGAVHLCFVRSTIAHASVRSIDTAEAAGMVGVVGVFTASDLDLAVARTPARFIPAAMARPWLATDVVRFVGEPVAVIAAESMSAAVDAAEMVVVDYGPLDVVVGVEAAVLAGSPLLFDEVGTNVCAHRPAARAGATGTADLFDGCEVVVSGRMVNQRVAAAPLESRATAAAWDGERLTMWTSTQHVHGVAAAVAAAFDLPHTDVRVIAPDVGGGFGAKIPAAPEDVVCAWVARHLGRSARWTETRTENMISMGQGRSHVHHWTIGGSRDGRITAYRLDVVADVGAYPRIGSTLPAFTAMMAPGTYDIGSVEVSTTAVVTNTTPIDAFRGAGRPEATATIERAVDCFAAEIGLDPVAVRRHNLIEPFSGSHTTAVGTTYDSGDYAGALDAVIDAAGYVELRDEQAQLLAVGSRIVLGIGVSTYVEITAGAGPPTEWGSVSMEVDGTVVVSTGSSPHGQGHETSMAMIVADSLGVPLDRVRLVWGDTAAVPRGGGTMGSRSLQLGGSAVMSAAEAVVEMAREFAAEHLEAAVDDVVHDRDRGAFHVVGTPSRSVDWASVVAGHAGDLQAETDYVAAGPTFPFGAHLAVVQVDLDTGETRLIRMVTCDDAGRIVNPLLADGQRHGGIAQGVAQALFEEVRHDDEGNPLTSNFSDYSIPSAAELPRFELLAQETPTPNNPLGAKGMGESGTIGATPAVQSAVIDALSHLGIRHLDMPATPFNVWRAITRSSGGSGSSQDGSSHDGSSHDGSAAIGR